MDYSLIGWIISGVIGFIIFCGVIWGAIRGLKKTAIRGIWLLVTAIVVYFISALIARGLTTVNIEFLGLDGEVAGSTATNLNDAIAGLLNQEFGSDFTKENVEFVTAILNLVPMILSPIIFTLLFWLLKYLLLPLNAIIVRVCFPNARQKYKRKLRKQRKLAKQSTLGFANNINGDEEVTPINNYHASSLENIRNSQYTPNATTKIENQELDNYINKLQQLKQENHDIRTGKTFVPPAQMQKQQNNNFVEYEKEQPVEQPQPVVQEAPQQPPQEPVEQFVPTPKDNMPKVKKRRLLGMVVGFFVSLFICCCTLVPINGIINATKEINKHKALLLDDKRKHNQGYLTALTDGEYDEIIKAYDEAIGIKILKYTGVEATSIFGFNNLAVAKKDKIKVKLSDDIKAIMKTVDTAGRLTNLNSETIKNYSVAELNALLDNVQTLIENVFDIDLLNYVGTYGIDFILTLLNEEKVNEITGDKYVSRILNASLDSIKTMSKDNKFTFKSFEEEFIKIVNIFRSLNAPEPTNNQNSLLKRILSNDFEKPLLVFYNLGEDYVNNVINSVFKLKLGIDVLPEVTNTLLSLLFDSQDITFVENELTSEVINQSINTLIDSCFNILDELNLESNNLENTLKNDSDIFKILKNIGKILDTVKTTYLANESYTNGVNKLTKIVEDELKKAIPDDYIGLRTQLINMVKTASDPDISWECEMVNIGSAIKSLKDENILTNNNSEITITLTKLSYIGKLIDDLEFIEEDELSNGTSAKPSKIFNFELTEDNTTYNSMVKVVSEGINFAKKFVDKNETLLNILDLIKENVLSMEVSSADILTADGVEKEVGTIDWSNEFTLLDPLFTEASKIINKEIDFGSITAIYESNIVKNIGTCLNKVEQGQLLKGITQELISYGLDLIKDEVKLDGADYQDLNSALQDTISSMKTKLSDEETTITNWESEFNIIHEILGIASTISSSNINIQDLPNYMKNLEYYINNEFIDNKSFLIDNITIKSILSPAIDILSKNVDDNAIKEAISDIKNNLENVNFEDKTSFLQTLENYKDRGLLIDNNNYKYAYRNTSNGINSYVMTDQIQLNSSNEQITYNNMNYYPFNISSDSSNTYGFRLDNGNFEIIKYGAGSITTNHVHFATDYTYTVFINNTTNPTVDDVVIRIYKQVSSDNQFVNFIQNSDELKSYYDLNMISPSSLNYAIVKDYETLEDKQNQISKQSIIVRESINGTVNYYKLIGFWEKEMMAITSLYELATDDGIELTSEIGAKLDQILNNSNPKLNSELITNQVFKNLIANKLSELFDFDETDDIGSVVISQISEISNNLKIEDSTDPKYVNVTSWESEFDGLIKLAEIDFTDAILDSFDYEDTTTDEAVLGVGNTLDELISNSNIVKFENIKAIVEEIVYSKINELSTEKYGNIVANIEDKLESYTITEYQNSNFSNEFKGLKVLIDLSEMIPNNYDEILDNATLTNISKRLDLTMETYISETIGVDIMNHLVEEIKIANQDILLDLMKDKFDTDTDDDATADFTQIFDTITDNILSFGQFSGDDYTWFFEDLIKLKDVFVEIDNFSSIEGTPTQSDIDNCNEAIDSLTSNILLQDEEGSTEEIMTILNKYFKI